MNKIIALIDLTELSDKVLQQSIALCKHLSAELVLGHMTASEEDMKSSAMNDKLKAMADQSQQQGVKTTLQVWTGDLFKSTPDAVLKSGANLAILGTHGQKGLKQSLFGSNIWKLVSHIPCSTLVINRNTKVVEGGFRRILLPTGPHPQFLDKVKQCETLKNSEGTLSLFAIKKPGVPLSTAMLQTIKDVQEYMDENNLKHEFVEKDAEGYSVGYSRDTIKYAEQEGYDLIAILSRVSEENEYLGKIDKENLVLNEEGIPVLCAR